LGNRLLAKGVCVVLGGFLALLSALTFALNNASARRGVLTGTVAQAMAISVPIGVPLFLVATAAFGSLATVFSLPSPAILLLSVAGIIHFVWGRYCNYRATKAMGAVLVGPTQQLSLIVALVLAVGILGEALTPLRIIGIALVLLGPALTHTEPPARGDRKSQREQNGAAAAGVDLPAPTPFKPNYAEGYLFAILSATGYGVSPVLVRLGLEDRGLGVSLAGGLVSYLAATLALALVLLWPKHIREVIAINQVSARWFTASGVLVCISQMFRYMALAVAPVSVVTPIQRLSIVFRVAVGWVMNPQHEVFSGRVILGTVVSLAGALALSVSTELFLSLIPLPDFVVAAARWQWP
jgi:drug/metabolite transporter (DMT)-like permease